MKLWVKIYKKKGAYDYEDSLPKYDLGTIVGQKTFRRYKDVPSMTEMLNGDTFWNETKYLIELTDGNVVEAWESEVFEPTATELTEEIEKDN